MMRSGSLCLLLLLLLGPAAATAPAAPTAPVLEAARQGDQLELTWSPAGASATYTVETTSQLVPGSWQPLGGAQGWPTTATRWSGPAPSAPATFYRLLVSTPAAERGTVQSQELLRKYSSADLLRLMQEQGLPVFSSMGADAWKIVYQTIDTQGAPTIASMLLVVPQGASQPLPFASYQHGTVTLREDVPSRLNDEGTLGLVLGGFGYIAVLPDYLGLGDSPGFHPYHHAASQASAVIDALRAARSAIDGKGATWNNQLFLTGYSQGGHATLAAQRELELNHAAEFPIAASAPSAGAFDLSGTTLNDMLSDRTQPNPYYFAYFLAAYAQVYDIAPSFADLLRPPYDTTLPPLFDGTHSGSAINAAMPARPIDILKPEVLEAFTSNPDHPLRAALRANDLHSGWFPTSRTRFYHCGGDRDVLPANSKVAFDAFKAAGAPAVELVDPLPFADHGGCAAFALLGTKYWFDGFRQ